MIRIGGLKSEPPKLAGYSGYAIETRTGDWLFNIAGLAYQNPPFNLRQKMMIRMLAKVMQATDSDLASDIFQDRIQPFFFEADRGQKLVLKIGSRDYRLKKKSRRNGRFDNWIRLNSQMVAGAIEKQDDGRLTVQFELVTTHSRSPTLSGQAELLPRSGLSVISDIDDTIKDSHVANRRELLLNTFVREFRCVDGMAAIYRNWQTSTGANFHYVSSSPWQLFDPLAAMRDQFGFPMGTMHLRNFRLRDQFLKKVMLRREGKSAAIGKLMRYLPDRKFLLVGDSGEKDPEIYMKMFRRFPSQIAGVFIRRVSKNGLHHDRVERLHHTVGKERAAVFATAEELETLSRPIIDLFLR